VADNRGKWTLRRRRDKTVSLKVALSVPREKKPPPKTPWLSDAEDLLNAVLSFAWRAGGSLVFGFFALFRREPAKRLLALEADGHVLSWATLLVTASAVFSALFPAAFDIVSTSPSVWVTAVLKASNIADYIDRFLPTLGVGLLACLVASIPSLPHGSRTSAQGPRLLASTLFALTLVVSLAASAAFRFVVVEDAGKGFVKWLEPWVGSTAANLTIVFGSVGVLALPVCFASAAAAVLACAEAPLPRLRPAWRVGSRVVSALAAGIGAWFVPIAIFIAATVSIAKLGPITAKFKDSTVPEEVAEFTALETYCSRGAGAAGGQALDCVLAARTAGKGHILLDFGSPALVLSSEQLGAWKSEQFRLREENGIEEKAKLESKEQNIETVAGGPEWGLSFASSTVKHGNVVALELGKPFVATLRINLPLACEDELLSYYLSEGGLYHFLYLRTRPIREASSPAKDAFAAIGPWRIPLEAFEKACPAKPSGR